MKKTIKVVRRGGKQPLRERKETEPLYDGARKQETETLASQPPIPKGTFKDDSYHSLEKSLPPQPVDAISTEHREAQSSFASEGVERTIDPSLGIDHRKESQEIITTKFDYASTFDSIIQCIPMDINQIPGKTVAREISLPVEFSDFDKTTISVSESKNNEADIQTKLKTEAFLSVTNESSRKTSITRQDSDAYKLTIPDRSTEKRDSISKWRDELMNMNIPAKFGAHTDRANHTRKPFTTLDLNLGQVQGQSDKRLRPPLIKYCESNRSIDEAVDIHKIGLLHTVVTSTDSSSTDSECSGSYPESPSLDVGHLLWQCYRKWSNEEISGKTDSEESSTREMTKDNDNIVTQDVDSNVISCQAQIEIKDTETYDYKRHEGTPGNLSCLRTSESRGTYNPTPLHTSELLLNIDCANNSKQSEPGLATQSSPNGNLNVMVAPSEPCTLRDDDTQFSPTCPNILSVMPDKEKMDHSCPEGFVTKRDTKSVPQFLTHTLTGESYDPNSHTYPSPKQKDTLLISEQQSETTELGEIKSDVHSLPISTQSDYSPTKQMLKDVQMEYQCNLGKGNKDPNEPTIARDCLNLGCTTKNSRCEYSEYNLFSENLYKPHNQQTCPVGSDYNEMLLDLKGGSYENDHTNKATGSGLKDETEDYELGLALAVPVVNVSKDTSAITMAYYEKEPDDCVKPKDEQDNQEKVEPDDSDCDFDNHDLPAVTRQSCEQPFPLLRRLTTVTEDDEESMENKPFSRGQSFEQTVPSCVHNPGINYMENAVQKGANMCSRQQALTISQDNCDFLQEEHLNLYKSVVAICENVGYCNTSELSASSVHCLNEKSIENLCVDLKDLSYSDETLQSCGSNLKCTKMGFLELGKSKTESNNHVETDIATLYDTAFIEDYVRFIVNSAFVNMYVQTIVDSALLKVNTSIHSDHTAPLHDTQSSEDLATLWVESVVNNCCDKENCRPYDNGSFVSDCTSSQVMTDCHCNSIFTSTTNGARLTSTDDRVNNVVPNNTPCIKQLTDVNLPTEFDTNGWCDAHISEVHENRHDSFNTKDKHRLSKSKDNQYAVQSAEHALEHDGHNCKPELWLPLDKDLNLNHDFDPFGGDDPFNCEDPFSIQSPDPFDSNPFLDFDQTASPKTQSVSFTSLKYCAPIKSPSNPSLYKIVEEETSEHHPDEDIAIANNPIILDSKTLLNHKALASEANKLDWCLTNSQEINNFPTSMAAPCTTETNHMVSEVHSQAIYDPDTKNCNQMDIFGTDCNKARTFASSLNDAEYNLVKKPSNYMPSENTESVRCPRSEENCSLITKIEPSNLDCRNKAGFHSNFEFDECLAYYVNTIISNATRTGQEEMDSINEAVWTKKDKNVENLLQPLTSHSIATEDQCTISQSTSEGKREILFTIDRHINNILEHVICQAFEQLKSNHLPQHDVRVPSENRDLNCGVYVTSKISDHVNYCSKQPAIDSCCTKGTYGGQQNAVCETNSGHVMTEPQPFLVNTATENFLPPEITAKVNEFVGRVIDAAMHQYQIDQTEMVEPRYLAECGGNNPGPRETPVETAENEYFNEEIKHLHDQIPEELSYFAPAYNVTTSKTSASREKAHKPSQYVTVQNDCKQPSVVADTYEHYYNAAIPGDGYKGKDKQGWRAYESFEAVQGGNSSQDTSRNEESPLGSGVTSVTSSRPSTLSGAMKKKIRARPIDLPQTSDDLDESHSIRSRTSSTSTEGCDSHLDLTAQTPDSIETPEAMEGVGIPWTPDRGKVERISEYTAEEELQDSRHFRTVTVGGTQYKIDIKVIEPYKQVLSHGGYYGDGFNAIIVFSACHLPDRRRIDYDYVMDNLFLYLLSTLELLVVDDYMLIYFHGATPTFRAPPLRWLHRCQEAIDRRLRKNLRRLLVVHPTIWLKTVILMTKPFVSSKFYKKISYVRCLKELRRLVPMEYIFVPKEVTQYDNEKYNKPSPSVL